MRLNKLLGINFNLIRNQAPYRNTNYLFYVRPVYQKHIRKYSNENENSRPFALFEKRQPYSLPNPFKVLLQNLSLRWEMARIDGAFSLVDFYRGSQMAMLAVSNKISRGDFESLNEMIIPGFVDKIKNRYPRLNDYDKSKLSIQSSEVFSQNITDFAIHTSSSTGNIVVHIKIQFVLMNNADELKKSLMSFYNLSFKDMLDKNLRSVTLADYGFICDYSQNDESKWLIYELNHYNWDHLSNSLKE